jgi:hypothetical protein
MTNSRKMWSPTDPKHYEGKTLKELEDSLVNAETFVKNHPKFEYGWHNEVPPRTEKVHCGTHW